MSAAFVPGPYTTALVWTSTPVFAADLGLVWWLLAEADTTLWGDQVDDSTQLYE